MFDVATTRRIEQEAAAQLAPHTLMQRAGLAMARLALAIAPNATTIWIACGSGNNGGDTIQLAPPFITTPAQIDSLINALGETIHQTA